MPHAPSDRKHTPPSSRTINSNLHLQPTLHPFVLQRSTSGHIMRRRGRSADACVSLCHGRKLDFQSSLPKTTRHSARPSNSASSSTNTTKLTEHLSPPRITSSRQLRADARAAALPSAVDEQNNCWSWITSIPTGSVDLKPPPQRP